MIGFPKPERRATTKGRKARFETKVETLVRGLVFDRDFRCRFAHSWNVLGACKGRDTWAHLERRSQTRGMDPMVRHTTANSIRACVFHHAEEEANRLKVEPVTDRGADGPLLCWLTSHPEHKVVIDVPDVDRESGVALARVARA